MLRAFEEADTFGATDAANSVNALAVHLGANVKMPRILKIAYGMQTQLLDANTISWKQVDMSRVDFQAHKSCDGLPAVRAL